MEPCVNRQGAGPTGGGGRRSAAGVWSPTGSRGTEGTRFRTRAVPMRASGDTCTGGGTSVGTWVGHLPGGRARGRPGRRASVRLSSHVPCEPQSSRKTRRKRPCVCARAPFLPGPWDTSTDSLPAPSPVPLVGDTSLLAPDLLLPQPRVGPAASTPGPPPPRVLCLSPGSPHPPGLPVE